MQNQKLSRSLATALGVTILSLCFAPSAHCSKGDPDAWWPDPATGLMWANRVAPHYFNRLQATSYCASIKLGGYNGWRLPTLDEAKGFVGAVTVYSSAIPDSVGKNGMYIGGLTIWTSTMYGQQSAYAVYAGDSTPESGSKSFGYTALCVRPMEPDILQLAKDAQVKSPVPDVQTLKAYGMIVHAHDAFAIAQYQKSITQANAALALKPKFAPAYWAMGVSYGMLGQWDQAVTNLQTAVKIDKYYNNPKAALKWALQGQKAARTGGSPKDKPPVWE